MSGAIKLKGGEQIPLNVQLSEFETGLYPQAILRNHATMAELASSPVDLDDAGDGAYLDESIPMPSDHNVFVTYKVYTDAGHTKLAIQDAGTDLFVLDTTEIERLTDKATAIVLEADNVIAEVRESVDLVAEIPQDVCLAPIIGSESVVAEIRESNEIISESRC